VSLGKVYKGLQGQRGHDLPGPLEGGWQALARGLPNRRTSGQLPQFLAARKGEAFNLTTGRPTSWERSKTDTTWYQFACQYVDMKWKQASAKYRKDVARALTAASPALLADGRGRPDDAAIRRALVRYGFNSKQRADPPEDEADVLAWLRRNSSP
jgi:hypothetical protein